MIIIFSTDIRQLKQCFAEAKFNKCTSLNATVKQLKSRFGALKQKHQTFSVFANNSGFGFDDKTKCVTGSEQSLDSYCAAHPKAFPFRRSPFVFYEVLNGLFEGTVIKSSKNIKSYRLPALFF